MSVRKPQIKKDVVHTWNTGVTLGNSILRLVASLGVAILAGGAWLITRCIYDEFPDPVSSPKERKEKAVKPAPEPKRVRFF